MLLLGGGELTTVLPALGVLLPVLLLLELLPILLRRMRLAMNKFSCAPDQCVFSHLPNAAHGRHIVFVAHPILQQPITNLPCKYPRVLLLEVFDVGNNLPSGTRLGFSN